MDGLEQANKGCGPTDDDERSALDRQQPQAKVENFKRCGMEVNARRNRGCLNLPRVAFGVERGMEIVDRESTEKYSDQETVEDLTEESG